MILGRGHFKKLVDHLLRVQATPVYHILFVKLIPVDENGWFQHNLPSARTQGILSLDGHVVYLKGHDIITTYNTIFWTGGVFKKVYSSSSSLSSPVSSSVLGALGLFIFSIVKRRSLLLFAFGLDALPPPFPNIASINVSISADLASLR